MFRRFGFLVSCALFACFFILALAAPKVQRDFFAHVSSKRSVSDTDSVAVKSLKEIERELEDAFVPPDTTVIAPQTPPRPTFSLADSLRADSLAKQDSLSLARVRRYIPPYRNGQGYYAPLNPRVKQPFYPGLGSYWRYETKKDSLGNYQISERVGQNEVRYPTTVSLADYLAARRERGLAQGFRTLSAERMTRRQIQQRGLGFNVQLPGSENSTFSNIFGNNNVDLRINGQANVDFAFSQQVRSDGGLNTRPQFDPTLKQDLRLGVTGTIGDKMRIDINWDTAREFDYENQLKLEYTGYEDEIIKRIIAGNVTLDNRSSLISGARNQFGIRTDMQIGGVNLSIVASQQKSNGAQKTIKGGASEVDFTVKPYEYEDNRHFFLGYYFRNHWETALANPTIISLGEFARIDKIEVWKLNTQNNTTNRENLRNVIALADLGENADLMNNPYGQASQLPNPNAQGEAYSDAVLEQLRIGSSDVRQILPNNARYGLGQFQQLVQGRDYDVDERLGYLSLKASLEPNAALAVAYRYETNDSRIVQIGDMTGETGSVGSGINSDRLVLKLLRQSDPAASQVTWPLTLRNIYSIPARNVQPDGIKVNLLYAKPGTAERTTLPDITFPNNVPDLLNATGLDRLTLSNQIQPDGAFDVRSSVFQNSTGRVIFPYLEPFGNRIKNIIANSRLDGISEETARNSFVLDTLYRVPQSTARTISGLDIYQLKGSYKGSQSSIINLGFLLTAGSVSVSANGNQLEEGKDYTVDYQLGSVQILNPAYLTGENELVIDYDSEQLTGFEQKSLLGLRADYKFQDKLELGLTAMRLTEKTPVDKFRIGQEPISNFIYGIDGRYNIQPAWLTRAVDALPFLQTKEPSTFSITGEFARLKPRVPLTSDFNNSRNKFRKENEGRDFYEDELQGTSYIEDFEGFNNSYSLLNAGLWRTASAPDSIGAIPASVNNEDQARTAYRARTAWMPISREMYNRDFDVTMPTDLENPVTPLSLNIIYPNINLEGRSNLESQARTLNLFFDPTNRGVYNYTTNLERFIDPAERRNTWGGFMQRIPSGYNNFNDQNIEYIEFVFRSYGNQNNPNAKLFVDLGTISEDVIPDGRRNTERGLSTTNPLDSREIISSQARFGDTADNNVILTQTTGDKLTQDLGIDGLSSYDDGIQYPAFKDLYQLNISGTIQIASEQRVFSDFLNAINPQNSTSLYANSAAWQAMYQQALRDPSGDDFGDFRDDAFFSKVYGSVDNVPIEKRFMHHFSGYELNSVTAQREIAGNTNFGSSQLHDTEILNNNAGSALNTQNSYFQYIVPLDETTLQQQAEPNQINDYVIGQTNAGTGQGAWYKVRIPVKRYSRRVGDIKDFSQIQHIRIWTSGHDEFFTLRFERIDLVGAQWRIANNLANPSTQDRTRFEVTSIDNEADASVYNSPPNIVFRRQLNANGTGYINAKEQALQLLVDNFSAGDQRAISKNFTQGLNLLRYKNLRMLTHLSGRDFNGLDLTAVGAQYQAQDLRLFVRLGANEDKDFYEYELPLTPSNLNATTADEQWKTYQAVGANRVDLNSLFVQISDLNTLKEDRRIRGGSLDLATTYYRPEPYTLDGKTARIGVRGNPSLSKITTIVLGVRNMSAGTLAQTGMLPSNGRDFKSLSLWLNDLRATDYDQDGGYAGIASMNVKLADFATLQANFNTRTEGFGGLESSLSDQQLSRTSGFGVTANMNLDKFLPRRAGWSIPLSYSIRHSQGVPKYSPVSGDIRISELIAQIDSNPNLSSDQKLSAIDSIRTTSESITTSRTLSVPISKRDSRSEVLQYLLDPITVQYNWAQSNSHNPNTEIDNTENWNAGVSYRLSNLKPFTLKPFFFTKNVPVLGILGRLQWNLLPQSITASAGAGRNWGTSRQRNREGNSIAELYKKYPFREQHNFEHKRNLEFQYKPFSFLDTNFGVDTGLQVLNKSNTYFEVFDKLTNTFVETVIDTTQYDLAANNYLVSRINIDPFWEGGNPFDTFTKFAQANTHNQRFSVTFDPKLNRYKALSFLQLRPISVNTNFRWQNGNVRNAGSSDKEVGNSVGNSLQVQSGVTLAIRETLKKFKFYRKAEESSRAARALSPTQPTNQAAENRRLAAEHDRRKAEIIRVHREMSEQGLKVPSLDSLLAAEGLDKPFVPSTESTPKKPFIKLPSASQILNKAILSLGAFRDFSFDYTFSQDGQVGNILNNYSMFGDSRFTTNGLQIPLKFRFGIDKGITYNPQNRTEILSVNVSDAYSTSHRFGGRTALTLLGALNFSFNADADIRDQTRLNYLRTAANPSGTLRQTPNGSVRSSAWAFGASIGSVLKRQLARFSTTQPASGAWQIAPNQLPPLTNQSVTQDFRKSFLAISKGTIDSRGFLPLPLPNINLDYQGLSKLPFLKGKVQSASLRSGYSTSYDSDFRNNAFADVDTFFTFLGRPIEYTANKEEINGVKVNERFSPLIGLNLRWANGLSIESSWNKTNSYSFNSVSFNLVHDKTDEASLSLSFAKQGLKLPIQLPFIKNKRLENTIRLTLTGRYNQSKNNAYNINKLLERYISANGLNLANFDSFEIVAERPTSRRNYNIEPRVSYVFSSRLTADGYVRITRQRAVGEIGNNRTITGGIQFRVNIAN